MKMIVALVRADVLEPIRRALWEHDLPALTVTEMLGTTTHPLIEGWRDARVPLALLASLRIECIVEDHDAAAVRELLVRHAASGMLGDGHVLIQPITAAARPCAQGKSRTRRFRRAQPRPAERKTERGAPMATPATLGTATVAAT